MDPEDGLIWVFGLGDDGVMAFTDFGIENLMELIRIHKENPNSSNGEIGGSTVRGLARMDTGSAPLPRFDTLGVESALWRLRTAPDRWRFKSFEP
ncbi:hypothetical protein [Bradyrhizobium australiense]|uniref:hypothetical protein n=1 Tax=Bradyrhizobium australiense TaxID=2721161 RepID=UPI0035E133B5